MIESNGNAVTPWTPRPLTRTRKGDGTVYVREKDVEAQIGALCSTAARTRKETLLRSVGRDDPRRLREETLVFALRECAAEGDNETAWKLAELLVERISGHVARQLAKWRLPQEDADDVTRDLFTALFDALFSREAAAEFWEVRFWVCLDRRLWSLVEKKQAALDIQFKDSGVDRDGEEREALLERMADALPGPELLVQRSEALTLLTERERLSVYLRYIEGIPEESEDPERVTVARILGVTGRSVRNYLRRAEQKLREWNEQ